MEVKEKRRLNGWIYLVVDPAMEINELTGKLENALNEDNVTAVQVWDNFKDSKNAGKIIKHICAICHNHEIAVLLNNNWELLLCTDADGVHFDTIPQDFKEIKTKIPKNAIIGLTCNNDLEVITWANKNNLDYISFCSVYPSSTSNSCELVSFEKIHQARKLTPMPIYLAGGIKPENIRKLEKLDFDGIAVVSGIMGSEKPAVSIRKYISELKSIKK